MYRASRSEHILHDNLHFGSFPAPVFFLTLFVRKCKAHRDLKHLKQVKRYETGQQGSKLHQQTTPIITYIQVHEFDCS